MEKSGIFQWLLTVLVVMVAGCASGAQEAHVGEETLTAAGPPQQEAKLEVGVKAKEEDATLLKPKETIKLRPEDEEELLRKKMEQNQITDGIFRTSLDAVKEQGEGEIAIQFSLENISEGNVEAVFGSGQMYDIVVFNDKGEAVYQWSHDKAFIAAVTEKKIKAGEKLAFSEEWDLRDNEGSPVPNGRYVIKVSFLAGVESLNLNPSELTDRVTVEI